MTIARSGEKTMEKKRKYWKKFFQEARVSETNINEYVDIFIHHRIHLWMLPELDKRILLVMDVRNNGDVTAILNKISQVPETATNEVQTKEKQRQYWKKFFQEARVSDTNECINMFIYYEITPWMLPYLNKERLRVLGVENIGDEIAILEEIFRAPSGTIQRSRKKTTEEKRRYWKTFFKEARVSETNIKEYVDFFIHHLIQPWMLRDLDEERLEALGVYSIDDKIAIWKKIFDMPKTIERNREKTLETKRTYWRKFFQEAHVTEKNIKKYIDIFIYNCIEPRHLPHLDNYRLRVMGVEIIGDEIAILKKIQKSSDTIRKIYDDNFII